MPHMAPFVWSMAPVMIFSVMYFVLMLWPTPFIFIPPVMSNISQNSWQWS